MSTFDHFLWLDRFKPYLDKQAGLYPRVKQGITLPLVVSLLKALVEDGATVDSCVLLLPPLGFASMMADPDCIKAFKHSASSSTLLERGVVGGLIGVTVLSDAYQPYDQRFLPRHVAWMLSCKHTVEGVEVVDHVCCGIT